MNQKQRTIALIFNVSLALIVHRCVSGGWAVTGATRDAWLIGILAYWILSLVSSPFFAPPKDVLANGIGAGIALVTIEIGRDVPASALLQTLKWSGLVLSLGVISLSLISIMAFTAHRESVWSKASYRIANRLGSGGLIFTPVVLVSAFAGYSNNLPAVLSIVILWVLAVSVGLTEGLIQLQLPKAEKAGPQRLGKVERFDSPGLVRVLLAGRSKWPTSGVVVLELPDQQQVFALPLFEHPGVEGRIGTAVVARGVDNYVPNVKELDVYAHGGDDFRSELTKELSGMGAGAELAGVVIEGSMISILRFETLSEDLAKGRIVTVQVGGDHVYYQITDAMTAEEVLSSELHGRRVASAIQLGKYVGGKGFSRFDWVPRMNSCVFLLPPDATFAFDPTEDQRSVGVLPGTECDIYVDIDQVVHYHAAVLGITGTGKTELSLDLVRSAVERGCKVVCVDFTGEYAKRLVDLGPKELGLTEDLGKGYEEALFAVETGEYGAGKEKARLKAFVDAIRPTIEGQVDQFLSGADSLAVLELAEITNTKASIRTTELFLSSFMAWAKKNRKKERILLVLEEAHTIIPETGGSGMDYESKWVVERIGQIALQGRKYGIGLLVVSQRTALVSKTILSQCNTFFAFSLVDQTSLNFLGSVLSSDHVAGISNLQPLEMICYGKAINSARPLLVARRFDDLKAAAAASLDA